MLGQGDCHAPPCGRLGAIALAAALVLFASAFSAALPAIPLAAAVAQTAAPPEEAQSEGDWPELVEPLTEPLAVIPPGHEDFLADMLGRGSTLAGGCTFASGQITHDKITVTYGCPAGEVAILLQHPSKAPSEATLTGRFAISLTGGSPPPGLTDELTSRIRSREGQFEWTWIGPTTGERRRVALLALVAVLAVGIASWLIVRRSARRASEVLKKPEPL